MIDVPVGVIVVAAGRGSRVGGTVPKQLLALGERSILQRSVAAFDAHPRVTAVVVVLPADLIGSAAALIGPVRAACRVVAGGDRRQDSVRAGFEVMPDGPKVILVHDAARPFVDRALIDRVIAAAARTGAAVPAVRARDTVKRVTLAERLVRATLPRDEIWLAQTPQGFTREGLQAAIEVGQSGVDATDEAMLAELAGRPVEVVDGDESNVKITTAGDVVRAKQQFEPATRVGIGYDLHRLVAGRPLVLAGEVLPSESGPLGHSDGDVVCHALADALFGAIGAGDIGQHFPNTDPRWKDAAGLDLLARSVAIVGQQGWRPGSVDVTVILERPKLVPHLPAIRENLARVFGLPIDRVSVKGKTSEGVDAVGRGEAIAAHAIAMLVPEVAS